MCVSVCVCVCVYTYTHIIHTYIQNGMLVTKKNEIIPFTAINMDLEIIMLSEVSQTEKDKYHMISLTYGV